MTTKYMNFDGIAYWAKVTEDEVDDYLGRLKWSIDLLMDDQQISKYVQAGLQGKVRDIDGGKGVRFIRDKFKIINKENVEFDPPKVDIWDKDQKKYLPFTGKIGNGSRVRVSVQVYEYKAPDGQIKKGNRMTGIGIFRSCTTSRSCKNREQERYKSPKATPWG